MGILPGTGNKSYNFIETTLRHIVITVSLCWPIFVNGQSPSVKGRLSGSWKFEKFQYQAALSQAGKEKWQKLNDANKGKFITFTADGKFKTFDGSNGKPTIFDTEQSPISWEIYLNKPH
ncbi:MAG: hypothetical protein ABJB86_06955 [Bacteroidota bacterium]